MSRWWQRRPDRRGAHVTRTAALALALLALAGCEQAMHDMYAQPKYKPLAPSPLFGGHRRCEVGSPSGTSPRRKSARERHAR